MQAASLNRRYALMSATLCFFISLSFAQARLPRLVSDGMVLQRDVPIRIWGWASPGQEVTVRFDGETGHTVTGDAGRWTVVLSPKKAGGPYNMDIDAINHIGLRNVYIGEVWVCSGQSNMELPMERVKEKYPEVIAKADNPMIRQFHVPLRYDFNKAHDDLASGRWEGATPATVLSFSAAAYFFAKELFDRYHVPIGLINNAVGGAPAEAWLSAEGLKAFPVHAATAARYADPSYPDSIAASERSAREQWYQRLWMADKGMHAGKPWQDPSLFADTSDWKPIRVPGYWADQGFPKVNGVAWYRKEIEVPAAMTGQPATLLLGSIVNSDSVYVNGVLSGTTSYQYPSRQYTLPAGLLRAGKNSLVVRVINVAGKGGFVPGKSYEILAAGQTIDLSGEWKYRLGATADPLPGQTFFQYKPLGLFNGMLAPLLPYTIRGVIWYQGESNTGNAKEYRSLFPAMISDWRRYWGEGDFPFLFVQLPNFMEARDKPVGSQWAELREAQRLTLALPHTAMAVTIDIGEWNDLHPLDKQDVGRRLALQAERIVYGRKDFISSGPMYRSMRIKENKVHLRFTETGKGLIAKGGGELKGFAIAGADHVFVWAKAEISGNDVIVWSDTIDHPVAVRYAWADNPQGANLYNRDLLFHDGLPASPFEAMLP
ncbi:MAG TPA: sialate O-acetylesterase [Puia sp.]|jgi:sialate O-acetylesterase